MNPFQSLTSAEREVLEAEGRAVSFRKGDTLFRSGEPVTGIFSIRHGIVKITQPEGGRDIALRFAGADEWVGHRSVFTSDTYRGSALAKEAVEADFVPHSTLLRFFGSNKDFSLQLIRLIAHDLEATESLLLERRKLNVPSRLIALFRTLDRQFGEDFQGGRLLSTKITKVEIAEMIGAAQEVVSRQLSKWKEEKLLDENGKRLFLSHGFLNRITR